MTYLLLKFRETVFANNVLLSYLIVLTICSAQEILLPYFMQHFKTIWHLALVFGTNKLSGDLGYVY